MSLNKKIGIFDSGIGGVTVLKEIINILPKEDYLYYSDSANNPYGDKNKETIIGICNYIVQQLHNRDCKTIVVACNTASAIAIETLRKRYPDTIFVGIEPAYKMIYDFDYQSKTLVMATKGTIESEKFNMLFHKYNNHNTYLLPCAGLADIIENGDKKELSKYLENTLSPYKNKVEDVVLGCTHYPLIKKQIKDILGDVKFFYGAHSLAVHLKNILQEKNILTDMENGRIEFIDSSNSEVKKQRFYHLLETYMWENC